MKKHFFILSIALLSALPVFADRYKKAVEIGFFAGCSYYIGDLNPMGHFNKFTKPAGGFAVRFDPTTRLAIRASTFFGSIEAHDKASHSVYQQQRNLNFQSSIIELSGQFEFNFLDYEIGNEKHRFTPYFFLGIGVFRFQPRGLSNGTWVDLQPLGTEGQGLPGGATKKKYRLTQISIPFGAGIKVWLSKNIGLSVDWGMRKTFTDYLDDVSTRYYAPSKLGKAAKLSDPSIGTDPNYNNVGRQRGNPTTKDWYAFAGITLTYKLKGKGDTCPGVSQ